MDKKETEKKYDGRREKRKEKNRWRVRTLRHYVAKGKFQGFKCFTKSDGFDPNNAAVAIETFKPVINESIPIL